MKAATQAWDGREHATPGTPPALDLRTIRKAFDGKPALIDASFSLAWGEVHAIVGENGAGKSTLMNIAAGVYAADDGRQLVDGAATSPRSPMEATAAGLGMVHQHFRLVESFTVAENVLLSLDRTGAVRTAAQAAAAIHTKAREIGLPVEPSRVVATLSTAERQRVEIVRVLMLGARILVLDEPTAVLSEEEAKALLEFVRRLARQGHAVVLITHKYREVAGYCDRITIMRHGRTVLPGTAVETLQEGDVARLMVGETVAQSGRPASTAGAVALSVAGLSTRPGRHGQGIRSVSFNLHAGEVLGLAGVGGNGQEELVACLTGLLAADEGTVDLGGRRIGTTSPRDRRSAGLRVIPADRFSTGLVRELSIADNLALTHVPDGVYGGSLHLARRHMERAAEAAIAAFHIRGATPRRKAGLLSGGNAQKVLLARELDSTMRVLIAHSPSRGLDMKATEFVREAIRRAVEGGAACLLISEDLEEVLSLSHRIAVMNRGSISGSRPIDEVSPEWIGAMLAGHV